MYELATGPLVWLALIVFAVGSVYRIATMLARARKDKVIYPYFDAKHGLRSLWHWVIPFNSVNMRRKPLFTALSFSFHAGLLLTPVFLLAHNLMLKQALGIRLPALPEGLTDAMTVWVLIAGGLMILRRMSAAEVRNVTTLSDYLIIAVVLAPFATGFVAYHQWFARETMLTLHAISGALWLAVIPFTRLSHILYFVFTRMYMGSEFGFRNARDW